MDYTEGHDEYDIVVFEDDRLKFFKEVDEEPEDEIEEPDDEYITRRYDNIRVVYDMMKEHFMYTETRYFDKVTIYDFNDYFHDINCDLSHGLEIDQEIPEFEIIPVKIRNPTIHEWIGMHYNTLKLSYRYMRRLSNSCHLPSGSFEMFCTLGYETSTI